MRVSDLNRELFFDRIDVAFDEAVQDVVADAKAITPVRTGRLKASIAAGPTRKSGATGEGDRTGSKSVAGISGGVAYAPEIEHAVRMIARAGTRFSEHFEARLREQERKRPLPSGSSAVETNVETR